MAAGGVAERRERVPQAAARRLARPALHRAGLPRAARGHGDPARPGRAAGARRARDGGGRRRQRRAVAVLLRAYRASGRRPPVRAARARARRPLRGLLLAHRAPGARRWSWSRSAADCDGWGMATLAAHPGGFARTAVEPARRSPTRTRSASRSAARCAATRSGVHVDLGPDARLDVALDDVVRWPRRALGALGAAHARARASRSTGSRSCSARRVRGRARSAASGSTSTARSPTRRRTGRAPSPTTGGGATPRRSASRDVMAAFAGGRVRLAGAPVAPTAVVVRLGGELLALAPPLARTRVAAGAAGWRLRTRGAGGVARGDRGRAGRGAARARRARAGRAAHASRARTSTSRGGSTLTVRRGGRLRYRGESALAGLEHGV